MITTGIILSIIMLLLLCPTLEAVINDFKKGKF